MAAKIKRSSKSLLLLFLAYLLPLCVPQQVTSLTTSFVYNFSSPGLTKDTVWSTGRVAYGQPVRLWDDTTGMVASFTSNFTFAIKPHNITSQGDGMAFCVGAYPSIQPQDSNGGFLGLVNNPSNPANTYFPSTVGVEFDAFRNTWDPDNTVDHVGVDVNGIMSKAYTALPDGSFNGTMSAWVRYDASSGALSVTLAFLDQPRRGPYNVTAAVDLREAGLPQDAAVGFSTATGDYIECHQILAWSFESTLARLSVVNDTAGGRTSNNIGLIAGLTSTGIVVLLLAIAVAAWLRHSRHLKETGIDRDMMDHKFDKGTGPRRFTYMQLSQATRGFSNDHKLGEGGFGSVYRGVLPPDQQGLHVAVKRVSKTSRQGRREYISEVTIISRLRHRNLVQLIGWCHEADEFLLVYELMTNSSLNDHLYDSTTTNTTMTWPVRYNTILGMGSALLYLHQEWEYNVMLDASFNAMLGDFGLARLIDHASATHTTALAGTKGYMDPESVVSSRASAASDVYSFGVVLLETACGRKPVVPQEDEGKVLLVRWVWDLYGRGQLLDAADARLCSEFDAPEMERVLVVGLWCVHPDHAARPSIRHAMNVLQLKAPLPDLPLEMPVATYGPPAGRFRLPAYTTGSDSRGGDSSSSGSSAAHAAAPSFVTSSTTGSASRDSERESTMNHVTDRSGSRASGLLQFIVYNGILLLLVRGLLRPLH
ncbi:hypothetical protein BS78_05G261500 [Paspalum vaginatum]|nr:hypothetical protein BS78_05G261500 [Paspalum vaginatum]